jgi:hypothetical protein
VPVPFALQVLDCRTYDFLVSYFQKKNPGLIEFINAAKNKPPEEPEFPDFKSDRSICQDI